MEKKKIKNVCLDCDNNRVDNISGSRWCIKNKLFNMPDLIHCQDFKKNVTNTLEESHKEGSKAIKDSGDRTVFPSGAVRDLQNNKNEDRLVPYYLLVSNNKYEKEIGKKLFEISSTDLSNFDFESMMKKVIDLKDLLIKNNIETQLKDLSTHYTNGAKKYPEYNWTKGIPLKSFLNSAARHYMKWCLNWQDEDHFSALLWNVTGLLYELEKLV